MRVNAYGLAQNLEAGKAYHVWLQPASGDPIDIGAIEVDHNGSGYAMKADLPAIDQGKAVMLTIDASDAKHPGQTVARADLPKLQTTVTKRPRSKRRIKTRRLRRTSRSRTRPSPVPTRNRCTRASKGASVQPRSILDRTGAPPYARALFRARAAGPFDGGVMAKKELRKPR